MQTFFCDVVISKISWDHWPSDEERPITPPSHIGHSKNNYERVLGWFKFGFLFQIFVCTRSSTTRSRAPLLDWRGSRSVEAVIYYGFCKRIVETPLSCNAKSAWNSFDCLLELNCLFPPPPQTSMYQVRKNAFARVHCWWSISVEEVFDPRFYKCIVERPILQSLDQNLKVPSNLLAIRNQRRKRAFGSKQISIHNFHFQSFTR